LWSVKIVEGNFIRSVSFTWSPSGLRGELRKTKYIIILIIIIFINCSWVVTRWQWLFYMNTKHEIGY